MTYMCPDRIKMDTFTHRNDTTDSPLIPIQKIQVKSNTEESWDDVSFNSFCLLNLRKKNTVRSLMTKSKNMIII